jgi:hypothetical protein
VNNEEHDMYEGELKGIEQHLRDGDYTADANSLRAIHVLLEEIKRRALSARVCNRRPAIRCEAASSNEAAPGIPCATTTITGCVSGSRDTIAREGSGRLLRAGESFLPERLE